jgi:hypothetical protein
MPTLSRGMLTIAVDDTSVLDGLCFHYRRSGFTALRLPCGGVRVSRPDAPSAEQSWREAALHLVVWRAMNPAATAVEEIRTARAGTVHPQEDEVATARYASRDF